MKGDMKLEALGRMAGADDMDEMEDDDGRMEWECPKCDTELSTSESTRSVKCPVCGARMVES